MRKWPKNVFAFDHPGHEIIGTLKTSKKFQEIWPETLNKEWFFCEKWENLKTLPGYNFFCRSAIHNSFRRVMPRYQLNNCAKFGPNPSTGCKVTGQIRCAVLHSCFWATVRSQKVPLRENFLKIAPIDTPNHGLQPTNRRRSLIRPRNKNIAKSLLFSATL